MKKLVSVALVALSMSAVAQAADCEAIAQVGQGIMTARQQDVPKEEVLTYIDNLARPDNAATIAAAKKMTDGVYEIVEIQDGEEAQQRLIMEYRDWVLESCQQENAAR